MKPLQKWRKKDKDLLAKFINNHTNMNFVEFSGFLTAVISGPTLLMPSQWLAMVEYQEQSFEELDNAEAMIGLVMGYYNDIATKLGNGRYQPLAAFGIQDPINEDDDRVLPLYQDWVKGYLFLVHEDIDAWQEGDDELSRFLAPLLSSELSDDELQEVLTENDTQMSVKEARLLPPMILTALVSGLYDYWLEQRTTAHPHQHDEHCGHHHHTDASHHDIALKHGRNDPCPCGSGKKYKKCCWIGTIH